jgi:Ribbon-helix-helix protein, copG family
MIRSTQAGKAERLQAAQRLLASGMNMAEAAMKLSREEGLSLRQAYRYLEQARGKDFVAAVSEPAVTISLKMPGDMARHLQAHAVASHLTTSEVIRRAIAAFLAAGREHG